jgi:hypothetical protein
MLTARQALEFADRHLQANGEDLRSKDWPRGWFGAVHPFFRQRIQLRAAQAAALAAYAAAKVAEHEATGPNGTSLRGEV